MDEMTVVERKPFHEAIVDILEEASADDLATLGKLIVRTKIPKGHDEILTAWNTRLIEVLYGEEGTEYRYVATDILEQKKELEAEKDAKPAENILDRFQFADEKHA
jgi:hypothetical protein